MKYLLLILSIILSSNIYAAQTIDEPELLFRGHYFAAVYQVTGEPVVAPEKPLHLFKVMKDSVRYIQKQETVNIVSVTRGWEDNKTVNTITLEDGVVFVFVFYGEDVHQVRMYVDGELGLKATTIIVR